MSAISVTDGAQCDQARSTIEDKLNQGFSGQSIGYDEHSSTGQAYTDGHEESVSISDLEALDDWIRNEDGSLMSDTTTHTNPAAPTPAVCELSSHRRKRRKLVASNPEQKSDEQLANLDGLGTQKSWFTQLQDVSRARASKDVAQVDRKIDTLVEEAPPLKRRGRPIKKVLPSMEGEQSHRPCDTSKETTAPRRTTRIVTNGKLSSHPAKVDQREPESSKTKVITQHAMAAKSGKNIKIKHGRITQTFVVVVDYKRLTSDQTNLGQRVQTILDAPRHIKSSDVSCHTSTASVHPFFTGTKASAGSSDVKEPVPWQNIVFKSNKPQTTQHVTLQKPAWPPLWTQHIGRTPRPDNMYIKASRLGKQIHIPSRDEIESNNIYDLRKLHSYAASTHLRQSHVCLKVQASQEQVVGALDTRYGADSLHCATKAVRSRALHTRNAFNRGIAAGPYSWPQQFSPTTWQEVLQPKCRRLFDWLGGLAVHNVQSGADRPHEALAKGKKKIKRSSHELDDFIAPDEEAPASSKHKTAVILVGPVGCGKTASVYAVAKQLGFEVFEIHSGMRRSQKDILDRVGDMAHNHLVQQNRDHSQDPSSQSEDMVPVRDYDDATQLSVKSLFLNKTSKQDTVTAPVPKASRPEQKQSLILFEEVDHLFDDDRGFWTAVQALIGNSKRPIVLTCNDLSSIPLHDLDVHAVLEYEAPSIDLVVPHLSYVSAAEGHILEPTALESLYLSKGNDLRASMAELDFWCQMGVGSLKGGLDWFPDRIEKGPNSGDDRGACVYSRDTYRENIDLLPVDLEDATDTLQWSRTSFQLAPDQIKLLSTMDTFPEYLDSVEDQSVCDVLSSEVVDVIYACRQPELTLLPHQLSDVVRKSRAEGTKSPARLFACLDPLMEERPVFPGAQGRLAPSLDSTSHGIATDIAPYVRSIVAYDLRLGMQRDELFSSQGKQNRSTRAARAAAEGGDKATTRRDKWFGEKLDLNAVMYTAGEWPQYLEFAT